MARPREHVHNSGWWIDWKVRFIDSIDGSELLDPGAINIALVTCSGIFGPAET
jgi:hypothetical protein